ncbi:MAG: MBL fold metallo-hydrolase [candidate division KSB1 bacterium]|nr:MBL fold metallo-hydrolase [candidate division KSB1 bacterium]
MRKSIFVLGGLAVMLGLGFVLAQQDWDKVTIKTTHVAGNVYMLEGRGGNIGVSVGEDGILLVDDQFAPLAEKIRKAVQNLRPGDIRFILNTHWHGDHTGGNPIFGKESTIIAHTNVRKRLMTEQRRGSRVTPPAPKEAWPVITFDRSVSIHFNGEEIKVMHYPRGHTDGDAVVFFTQSNVVHMGDDFFSGRFPFVDLDSGGDVEGLARNIGQIINELPADVKIIPGHGPISTLDDLKAYHTMLKESIVHVRKQIEAGKDLAAVKAAGVPKEYSGWGWRFISAERWLEIVYRSLTKK